MKMLINVEKNSIQEGTRSHKTVQVVGKELLPFIDKTFPTYKVGNARILMGDSLAGSIALLTLTYPTIFSQVAIARIQMKL